MSKAPATPLETPAAAIRTLHVVRARNWVWRSATRYDEPTFTTVSRGPSDPVIRLRLSLEEAHRRKPDTRPAQLRRSLEVVRQLRWPKSTHVVDIDTSRPLADVLLGVKRSGWEAL